MSARPVVTVQGKDGETMPLPAVFLSPIRPDLVNNVHTALRRNRRQPYKFRHQIY
jgi:large subunit ribosomal protein L4e